jgi:hypothetical protein
MTRVNQVHPSYANYTQDGQSYMNYPTAEIFIGDDAPRCKLIPVFKRINNQVTCVGVVTVWGILAYIFTVEHEWGHWFDAYEGYMIPYEYNEGVIFEDKDEDGLWDDWEDIHHLNSNAYDSCGLTNILPVPTGFIVPDSEIPAHVQGLGMLGGLIGLWEEDWAGVWSTGTTSGLNWGFSFPTFSRQAGAPALTLMDWGKVNHTTRNYWYTNPSNIPFMHPWYYQPLVIGPSGWEYGMPIQTLPQGSILQVKDL